MSQGSLAREVGVTPTQVYLVEKGTTLNPHRDILERYARVLGVSPAYLRWGVETQAQETPGADDELETLLTSLSGTGRRAAIRHLRAVRDMQTEYETDTTRKVGGVEVVETKIHVPEFEDLGEAAFNRPDIADAARRDAEDLEGA